ncbi:hypothetical protein GCM10022228_03140 [Halomonas cibimaris]|uniref:Transcriptional regulator n=1 Tax=Halomonas cibimaris TaxID=657012 RepID=A0ABP7L7D3_9GAMM
MNNALKRYQDGCDPKLIELRESSIFPHLIAAQPSTARKSRTTGVLLGRPTPQYIERGRRIVYRLSDLLTWMGKDKPVSNTAEANLKHRENSTGADDTPPND